MIVSDVYDDVVDYLGFGNQATVFSRLTDAIETLANKGQWEPLLVYVVIPTTSDQVVDPNTGGTLVFLPNQVEVPLKVNLNHNPTFSRDSLYEFTMNGPGSHDDPVDWSWVDQGERQTLVANQFGTISSTTDPNTRVIRITKGAPSVRMLARLRTTKITSLDQFIPLHSKMAILLMVKALENYRKGTPEGFQLGQGQEQQALKFLSEEQQSRGIPFDIAKLDKAPLVGYPYHSNNLVFVSDIYDEAASICGGTGRQHVFDSISEAIEVLANKGQWDGMTAYLEMAPTSDLIGLPRQVEIPIRINIENKPSMSRSRLFEFSINGPGTDLSELTTLTWEDCGDTPVMKPLTTPSPLTITGSPADAGKRVAIYGIDVNDKEVSHIYTIPGPHDDPSQSGAPIVWKTLYTIQKDLTQGGVNLLSTTDEIAYYYPDETAPKYRCIKLNKKADFIKIMFRRSSLKVSYIGDIIPLKSRSAITTMMRALQLMKDPQTIQAAQALEAQALKFLQEEEQSRLAFIQAAGKDQMPAFGITTNTSNVVTVGEVWDDACDIFGPIGQQRIFDAITDAMELMANKSQWDGLDGYIDIVADNRGYISFPRKVETPIAVNFCRTRTTIRNKWYEFHMNGFGTTCNTCDMLDDAGDYPLVVEPNGPSRLFARTFIQSDTNRKLRAYGYDNAGNWIRSLENGVYVDGEIVPVNLVNPTSEEQGFTAHTTQHEFRQVTRISKDTSDMPIDLYATQTQYQPADFTQPAIPAPSVTPLWLASYEATETEPMFRRMRIPKWVTWLRMRYRMRTLKLNSMTDVLNMKSKTALVTMMKAMKALSDGGDVQKYAGLEAVAVKLISEEQMSRSPSETFDLQFDTRTSFADPLQGQY